jgi:hypothetical protein
MWRITRKEKYAECAPYRVGQAIKWGKPLFLWVVSPTEGAKKIGVGIGGKLERSWDGI